MTITVGTDAYLNISDADSYWESRNNSTWATASDENKEKALIEATQYIDGAFSFIGTQKLENVLAWPRIGVVIQSGNFAGLSYDSDTIPPQVKSACAELALIALSDRLVEVKDRGGMVKREKVDVIETEYMDWAPAGKSYSFASMILKPLLSGSSGGMKRLQRV